MPKIQNWIFYQEIKLTDVNWKTFVNMQLNAHITRHNKNNCTKCDHSVDVWLRIKHSSVQKETSTLL